MIRQQVVRSIKSCIRKIRFVVQKCVVTLFRSRFSKKTSMTVCEGEAILQSYSPKPVGRPVRANQLHTPFLYDLQIIVPAYNVEQYLTACITSILQQNTKYNYHVVIVDDGSRDGTGKIADSFAANPRVEVIHQENRGFSGARNRALEDIRARYIMFVDSDDMLVDNAVEALMDAAVENHAQIVQGEHFRMHSESECCITQEKGEAVGVMSALGNLTGFAWGKVFDSRLFSNLIFPEGFWFEDSVLSFLCYPRVKRAYVLPQIVYAYRQNPHSISNSFADKPKCIDSLYITELLMGEHHELALPVDQTYVEKVFRQIILNESRMKRVPDNVKEAAFVLTGDLVRKYLPEGVKSDTYQEIINAIYNNDYGVYRAYVSLFCRA